MGHRARLPALPVFLVLIWMLLPVLPGRAAGPSLVPLPAQITMMEGHLTIDGTSTVAAGESDPGAVRAASYLLDVVRRARGLSLQHTHMPATIVFRRDLTVAGAESLSPEYRWRWDHDLSKR